MAMRSKTYSVLRTSVHIVLKDLAIERRTGELLVNTGLFAFLVVVIASLAFYLNPQLAVQIAPGVLWIAIAFSGVLALNKTWAREREWSAFYAMWLSPAPRLAIYLAKLASTLLFMLVIEAFLLPLVAVFFHLNFTRILFPLLVVLLTGTIGFVAAGTLFAAMSLRTRARELMLSVALFPLITPTLLASVVATRELFAGAGLSEIEGWLRVILAFDLIFLVLGAWLFEPLMSD